MKKTWTKSINDIKRELELMTDKMVPLTFCQHGCKAGKVYLQSAIQEREQYLVFKLEKPLEIEQKLAILFYQMPLHPLKGLEVSILQSDDLYITTSFPTEIFQVERRRLPRIKAMGNSQVSFIVEGSSRLSSCKVKDISLEGAQLIGKPLLNMENKLAPLTFSLGMHYDNCEKVVIVSEAQIVRIVETGNGLREYGIHFSAADTEQEKLEEYILYRQNEDYDLQGD